MYASSDSGRGPGGNTSGFFSHFFFSNKNTLSASLASPKRRIGVFGKYAFTLSISVLLASVGQAQNDQSLIPETSPFALDRTIKSEPYYGFYSYTPQRRDYSIDVGTMYEERDFYWLGGTIGFHIGKCLFSHSETCQQYADVLGGFGGRDGYTEGLLTGSLRWQFVQYPKPVSPFARMFVGTMSFHDDARTAIRGAYGLGYGFTIPVHQRLDLKLEMRAGYADQAFSQIMIGFGFRADKWIEYFAKKIQGVGTGALDATGKVLQKSYEYSKEGIKATGEAAGKVLSIPQKKTEP